MSGEPARGKTQFKDYCLILQVHPEADAAMIDAAYWHLAQRYNEAAVRDPHARKQLEELNEAYNVLGLADRRDEYMKVRAAVLGAGALPMPPLPAPETPPLAIMARQRPRPRGPSAEPEQSGKPWTPSAISSVLAIPFVLALAVATFLAGASPEIVAGLLIVGLLFMAVPLAPTILRLRPSLPRLLPAMPSLRLPVVHLPPRTLREQPAAPVPLDTARIQSSTKARADQLRRREAPAPDQPSPFDPRD